MFFLREINWNHQSRHGWLCTLTDFEWKAIYSVAKKEKPPQKPPSISQMIKIIACFGGYLDRKNDPPPGYKAIWIGHQRCREFVFALEAMAQVTKLPF